MRNSFSLLVYFLLGCKCNVKIVYKTSDTASGNMKLIPIIFFISLAVDVKSNEHFTFAPKFHPPNSGIMLSSDSSIYLPPESHTTVPFYQMKSVNNLPFPYLPHTETKSPLILPTSYPVILSSTLLPIHNDNEEDEKQPQPFQIHKYNHTHRGHPENRERRDSRPKLMNYQPIDRIDMKPPHGFLSNNLPVHQNQPQQKATARSMIISPEQPRNSVLDQFRGAASYQEPHFLPAPNTPGVYISSTTETAVPILRLSNEMDLDGSFSYEALGADQTHYVQHSRMENTGTDKEEQVVEGSYSYIGDNGQTYTVNYIADSKGFRASGDHLPVAPPIPEIIQRAVLFNLAEEAKKPPNQKSWNEEKENEFSESEIYHRFVIPPTARPLFTGKTPESFSFGFSQADQNSQNLISAASSQNQIRSNNDFSQNHLKGIANNGINAGTISPQITFLASQGAHVPSANVPQSISRVFTTERTTLPRLVNFEASVKQEPIVEQSENNKGLWRWQYGVNANLNQTPEKNSISRSSGAGDDVMINFGDMTADQYTKMLKSQLEPNIITTKHDQISQPTNVLLKVNNEANHNPQVQNAIRYDLSTETSIFSTQRPDWQNKYTTHDHDNSYQFPKNAKSRQNIEGSLSPLSKLVTQNDFVPQSQLITQSYDYDDVSYEPKKIIISSSTVTPETSPYFIYSNKMNNFEEGTQNSLWSASNQFENVQRLPTTDAPVISTILQNIKYNNFALNEHRNDFKPILKLPPVENQDKQTTTTETVEDILETNIFLKNLFKSIKSNQLPENKIKEESKYQTKKLTELKPEKASKFIQIQAKPHNDIKLISKKPLDFVDIMNYLSAKNNFESIKIKPKSKYGSNNHDQRSKVRFIPVQHEQINSDDEDDEEENVDQNDSYDRTGYYHPDELRGIIKNYKVLQRNNSAFKNEQEVEELKRGLSPPPVKIVQTNLPPLGRAGPSMKSYLPPTYV